MSIYDFKVKEQNGNEKGLSDYKGKTLLIVNTATACGFTPQYDELQAIYDEYKDKGLEILDFPCNQFGAQAQGTDDEIHSFCSDRYGITFPQFSKIDVNGENAIPLFKYLTDNTQFEGFGESPMGAFMSDLLSKIEPNYKETSTVKWNFTKFLINKNGEIVARYEPTHDIACLKAKLAEII